MEYPKRSRTRNLISLSMYVLLIKNNYDDISVTDICDRAKISRMSFYRYYSSKEDIFIQYCDERFEEFFALISNIKNITIKVLIKETISYMKQYSKQILVLKKIGKIQLLTDRFYNYTRYVVAKLEFNDLDNSKNNPYLASFLAGGLVNAILVWFDHGMKDSLDKITEYLLDIFYSK